MHLPRAVFTAVAAVSLSLAAAGSASAVPANPGGFPGFLLSVEALREGATPAQIAAIDAANAMYQQSTASTVTAETLLLDKMIKALDKQFADNAAYQTAADNFVAGHFITRVGFLPPAATLASADNGISTLMKVQNGILKLTRKLDLNKDNTPAGAGDYAVNRGKFRKRMISLAKFCETAIRKYG